MTSVPGPAAAFPFVHWEEVRFRDLDALGHVNNAVFATYLESARIAYYHDLTGLKLEQFDLILAELTISYKAPAFYGERLAVGVRVASFGTKSFVMEYAVARAGDEALLATARSVLVRFDYKLGRSVPVPEEFRQLVARRQGGL
jgi:acyl-CoA thioester hydrolase